MTEKQDWRERWKVIAMQRMKDECRKYFHNGEFRRGESYLARLKGKEK